VTVAILIADAASMLLVAPGHRLAVET